MRFRVFETGSRRSFGLLLGSALMVSLLVTMAVNRGAIADDWGSETPVTPVALPALTPAESRLKADVSFLAADAREGRRRDQGHRGRRRLHRRDVQAARAQAGPGPTATSSSST